MFVSIVFEGNVCGVATHADAREYKLRFDAYTKMKPTAKSRLKRIGLTVLHFTGAVFCNVGGFIVFITIFFFTLGSWIEKLALQNQLKNLVTAALTTTLWSVVPPSTLQTAISFVNGTQAPDLSSEDASVTASNASLRNKSFAIMIPVGFTILAMGLFFGGLHERLTRHSMKDSWKEVGRLCLMTFIMIGSILVTELAFALLVSRFYLTVAPSWVNGQIIQIIIDSRQ
jgi:hypothetical protein